MGSLEQWDGLEGTTADGWVTETTDVDSFRITGDVTAFSFLTGGASVSLDGTAVDPGTLATGGGQDANDTSNRLDNTVWIESTAEERAVYELAVTGRIEPGENANLTGADYPDSVSGSSASGSITAYGADSYRFSGEITEIELDGPAVVLVNGERIAPSNFESGHARGSDGTRALTRINPPRQAAVPPETEIRFTIGVDHPEFWAVWYVDGERFEPLGPIHDGYALGDRKEFFEHSFPEEGEYTVRTEVFEGYDRERMLGSLAWEIDASRGQYASPTVELVSPAADQDTLEPGETYELTARAQDPDGNLSHIAWWVPQCDTLLGISEIAGAEETATVAYEYRGSCWVSPVAVDETGITSEID